MQEQELKFSRRNKYKRKNKGNIHSFIYPFFIEHLLHVRHCARSWEHRSKKNKQGPWPWKTYSLVEWAELSE